jgi:hypothetical protein
MGRRDYEMEAAVQSVEGAVAEPVVRALIVGSAGSQDGTLGGVFKQFFNRSRRKTGLRSRKRSRVDEGLCPCARVQGG